MVNWIHKKGIEAEKKGDKDERTCKFADYLKWASKPSYMSYKICDNDLVATRKSKVTNNA